MDDALETHLLAQGDAATRFFWHRLRWRYVAGHLPAGTGTLLDVGAGSGITGLYLARDRPEMTYTFDEPIASLRSQLRQHFGADSDLHGVDPLPPVTVVTLLDVLEHIPDDRKFLRDLVGRLSHGTTIIVTVPSSMRFWSEWDVLLGHERRYESDTLDSLFAAAPVDVVETGRLFPEMVPAAWWRTRRHPVHSEGPTAPTYRVSETEFPKLPAPVDRMLYHLGRPGVRYRRYLPIGTSLCAVLRVR